METGGATRAPGLAVILAGANGILAAGPAGADVGEAFTTIHGRTKKTLFAHLRPIGGTTGPDNGFAATRADADVGLVRFN